MLSRTTALALAALLIILALVLGTWLLNSRVSLLKSQTVSDGQRIACSHALQRCLTAAADQDACQTEYDTCVQKPSTQSGP